MGLCGSTKSCRHRARMTSGLLINRRRLTQGRLTSRGLVQARRRSASVFLTWPQGARSRLPCEGDVVVFVGEVTGRRVTG